MEIVYEGVGVSTLATDRMVIESPLSAGMGCWRMIIGLGQFVVAINGVFAVGGERWAFRSTEKG